ncbi:MAG: hypothetical protein GDA41_00680 [Rhodospirillales bacterium]|nr:hypothetical protein [Rhodospirillales bacterium]
MDRALAEGRTLRQFREELELKLKAAGWWGRKIVTDPRTGRRRQVPKGVTPGFDNNPGAIFLAGQSRYEAIAGDLSPEAQGIELGLIHGIRTGKEHLAVLDLDAERPIPGGRAAPVAWDTKGKRGGTDGSNAVRAAAADPARRISVVHNHPEAKSLSSGDLSHLDNEPGLARIIAVDHDGSLYRASDPIPGLDHFADRLWQLAWVRLVDKAAGSGMNSSAMRNLANHAANITLDRAGYMSYAYTLAGGSLVNLQRFGEDRMQRLIAGLVQWLGSG